MSSGTNTICFSNFDSIRSEPVCNKPHKMVCSPIRSDFTSATKDESKTPALCPPVPTQYALAISIPSDLNLFAINHIRWFVRPLDRILLQRQKTKAKHRLYVLRYQHNML